MIDDRLSIIVSYAKERNLCSGKHLSIASAYHVCWPNDIRSWGQPRLKNEKSFSLSANPAGFPIGLTHLDIDRHANIRIRAYAEHTNRNVKVHLDAWGDTTMYSAGCTWLDVYAKDRDFQFGCFSTMDDHPSEKPQMETSRTIRFPKPFHSPPKVVVWFNELDMSNDASWRCKTYTRDITPENFVIHIDTWSDTTLYSATVSWIAYPSNRPNIASGSFNTMDVRPFWQPATKNNGWAKFDKKFESTPRVFAALDWLDIGNDANLWLQVVTSGVNVEGFTWDIDGWSDTTTIYSAGASYVAILDF